MTDQQPPLRRTRASTKNAPELPPDPPEIPIEPRPDWRVLLSLLCKVSRDNLAKRFGISPKEFNRWVVEATKARAIEKAEELRRDKAFNAWCRGHHERERRKGGPTHVYTASTLALLSN